MQQLIRKYGRLFIWSALYSDLSQTMYCERAQRNREYRPACRVQCYGRTQALGTAVGAAGAPTAT